MNHDGVHPLNYKMLQAPTPAGKHYEYLKNTNQLKMKPFTLPYLSSPLPDVFDWRNVNGSSFVDEPFD